MTKLPFRRRALCAGLFALCGCEPKDDAGGDWSRLPPDAGVRMFTYVRQICEISPRDAGTPGAGRASRYIAQQIRAMGVEPVADCWEKTTAYGQRAFCNIYADFPGTTGKWIVFGSHYDTKAGIPGFQGANDGASTTAVLLGLVEQLAETRPQLALGVRFAFFDGEECFGAAYRDDDGLHGSSRLAREFAAHRDDRPLLGAVIVDMLGDRNLKIEMPRNVSPDLCTIVLKASQSRKDLPKASIGSISILDDHIPFLTSGFQAVDLIDFDYGTTPGRNDYWHTALDTPDKLSAASLHGTGNLLLAVLARINEANAK